MPGFDGTGPMGKGPGTGGKRGLCPEGMGARFNGGFYPPGGNAYGDSPYAGYPNNPGMVYGAGRGGFPRGCGKGRCLGGRRGR